MIDYIADPEDISFEAQVADEKIALLLRKHFATNTGWILLAIILFFLPLFFLSPLPGFSLANYLGLDIKMQIAALLVWYLFLFGFIFEEFMVWYFNIYIVTNERVVDVDFYQLLYKKVSAADLHDLQDVTFTMGGVAQAIFNYGDIQIQTAAETDQFDFFAVPKPAMVQKVILSMAKEVVNARNTSL